MINVSPEITKCIDIIGDTIVWSVFWYCVCGGALGGLVNIM